MGGQGEGLGKLVRDRELRGETGEAVGRVWEGRGETGEAEERLERPGRDWGGQGEGLGRLV